MVPQIDPYMKAEKEWAVVLQSIKLIFYQQKVETLVDIEHKFLIYGKKNKRILYKVDIYK